MALEFTNKNDIQIFESTCSINGMKNSGFTGHSNDGSSSDTN